METALFQVDLHQAVTSLARMRIKDLNDAIFLLDEIQIEISKAQIVKKYAPEWFETLSKQPFESGETDCVLNRLDEAVVGVIEELFPVWDMREEILNVDPGERPIIRIVPQGLSLDLDYLSIDELKNLPEEASELLFAKLLDSSYNSPEVWELAAEHFGWPKILPAITRKPHEIKIFAAEKFEQLLEDAELDDLLLAFHTIWQVTGNTFLDWNDETNDYIPLTLENVDRLVEEWHDCEKALERLSALHQKIQQEPGLLALALGYWEACLETKTFAEIWEPESEDRAITVDPFYGPLTGEVEQFEEEESWT